MWSKRRLFFVSGRKITLSALPGSHIITTFFLPYGKRGGAVKRGKILWFASSDRTDYIDCSIDKKVCQYMIRTNNVMEGFFASRG